MQVPHSLRQRRQALRRLACWLVLPAPFVAACGGGSAGEPAHDPGVVNTFALPLRIVVSVAPYASIDQALQHAADIDWRRDDAAGRAATLAYAARELREHLALAGVDAPIVTRDTSPTQPAVVLWAADAPASEAPAGIATLPTPSSPLGEQGYAITPQAGRLFVTAEHRIGVLYGVYGLLQQLGFAWYDPWETHAPPAQDLARAVHWQRVEARPRISLRGFWVYGEQDVPDAFAVWLARNRLNVGGLASAPMQAMLGLRGWGGTHDLLQQEFSHPGLFEQHPDWFAVVDGERRPVASTGNYFNPAFASPAAARYFADRMIERLESGDLRGIDVLNIWPADDRFDRFDQSPAATAIGNPTDNLLFFYANVGTQLRQAHASGRLSRRVIVAGISYFRTMTPPSNPAVVAALGDIDYVHLFYPIERDWSGRLDADLSAREATRDTMAQMSAWDRVAKLDYGVVEYHNLSAYSAIGLSDMVHFPANFAAMTSGRSALYAYMHPLLRNPGPRRMTNLLLSRLAWNEGGSAGAPGWPEAAGQQLLDDYFSNRYGAHAAQWRAIHELMAASVENAKEMFWTNSLSWLLLQEQIWSVPFYPREQAAAFIPRFRSGGTQDLPAAYSGTQTVRATFRGLDESLQLQEQAARRWVAVLGTVADPAVRQRMDSDLLWFEATAARYRLTSASCDYLLARVRGDGVGELRSRIAHELALLRAAAVTADTISPVDQRAVFDLYAAFADIV